MVRFASRAIAWVISSACFLSPASGNPRSAGPLFIRYCSGCHGINGAGTSASSGIPGFRDFVGAFAADEVGRAYVLHVPGVVNTSLDDESVAAVINFVMTTWGGGSLPADFRAFTRQEVAASRQHVVTDVVALRREAVRRLRAKGIATAPYPWP
jgi:mono/diheme cytochrome c family protein